MRDEELAQRIFRAAGVSEVGKAGVGDLAVALLGQDCIRFATQERIVVVQCAPVRIVLRRGIALDDLGCAIAAGIVEWWRTTKPGGLGECSPSGVTSRLVVPTLALHDALGRIGPDPAALAREFSCSPRLIVERLAAAHLRRGSGTRIRQAAS